MKKLFFALFLLIFWHILSQAQELNAKVTVNSSKIEGVNKEVFSRMQTSLNQLMNQQKWTEFKYENDEKIECNFSITINGVEGTNFSGEIQISARRPVYNSSYTTTLFNFRDADLGFEYTQGQTLEYNETMATNNLVSILSFYTYVILGLDFDSFTPGGGRSLFEQAMNIANYSQSMGGKGWSPFVSDKDRYALGLALTEESSQVFHGMWYNYHRKGLDEMAANSSRGRLQVIASMSDLNALYQARPASVLLTMYGDCKLDELVAILEKANEEEKKEAIELLGKLYPTKSSVIDKLKKR